MEVPLFSVVYLYREIFVVPERVLYCVVEAMADMMSPSKQIDGDGMDARIFYHMVRYISCIPGIPNGSMESITSVCPESCG